MLSDLQRRAAEAIVNVFKTSQVLGDYSKVTNIPGDSGLAFQESAGLPPTGVVDDAAYDALGL